MTLGFQDQKATTSRFQDQKAAPSRFQGVFSEDKKQRHRDSITKKPRHQDSKTKKPRHRISAEFWPLSSLIIGRAEFSGSRRLPMFYKIGVPEIFAKFTEISVLESFFDKAAVLQDCSFVKKRHQHMYFCVYIAKFLRTPYLQNTSGWTEHYRTLFLLIPPFHTRFDPLITLLSFAPWFFSFIYSCKYSS